MGGDRELVIFSGLLAGALIFSAQEVRATVFGIGLSFLVRFLCADSWVSQTRSCAMSICGIAATRHIIRLAARPTVKTRQAKGSNTNDDSIYFICHVLLAVRRCCLSFLPVSVRSMLN